MGDLKRPWDELLGFVLRDVETIVELCDVRRFLEALGTHKWDATQAVPATYLPVAFRKQVDVHQDKRPEPPLKSFQLERGINAGTRIVNQGNVYVGDRLSLVERISDVVEKQGKRAPLLFVTQQRVIHKVTQPEPVQINELTLVFQRGT